MYAVYATIDPATDRYRIASPAPTDTLGRGFHSPVNPEQSKSINPPSSICAPELIGIDFGTVSILDSAVPTLHEIDPSMAISAPIRFRCPTGSNASNTTPLSPSTMLIGSDHRNDSFLKTPICSSAVQTGIIATSTDTTPDGTLCSAQKTAP